MYHRSENSDTAQTARERSVTVLEMDDCVCQEQQFWMAVEHCPACGSAAVDAEGKLPDSAYMFGTERITFPESGIAVAVCADCGLVYKRVMPKPAFLSRVFARQAGAKWMEPYDFARDLVELRKIAGEEIYDLLDVGACSGALLKACAEAAIKGRRSALDVVRHPGLERHMSGEFIEGFLDAHLQWSGLPYQVVTLFDVLEHLYHPQVAFRNLRMLVNDGGLVLIETGNIESQWPRRYGPMEWWYVRLFEHHIFWSRRSLERIIQDHGFRIIFWEERRHKSRADRPPLRATRDLLKIGLYCTSPATYSGLAGMLGKQGVQPWSPFTRDHFRVYLKKI